MSFWFRLMIHAIIFFAKCAGWGIAIGRDKSGENVKDIIIAPSYRLDRLCEILEEEEEME